MCRLKEETSRIAYCQVLSFPKLGNCANVPTVPQGVPENTEIWSTVKFVTT